MTAESSAAFFRDIAKKRMGAGALLFDEAGRLLIVKPTYKPPWEIPGGIVELDESPREAALREIREEIGLELAADRLVLAGLDYMAAGGAKTEALMFVFSGGTLTRDEQAGLRVEGAEIG